MWLKIASNLGDDFDNDLNKPPLQKRSGATSDFISLLILKKWSRGSDSNNPYRLLWTIPNW